MRGDRPRSARSGPEFDVLADDGDADQHERQKVQDVNERIGVLAVAAQSQPAPIERGGRPTLGQSRSQKRPGLRRLRQQIA
jgi:hypothetical protein